MFTPCLPRKTRALTDRCKWRKGKHNRFRTINQDFIASATEERCFGLAVKHAGWMFLNVYDCILYALWKLFTIHEKLFDGGCAQFAL